MNTLVHSFEINVQQWYNSIQYSDNREEVFEIWIKGIYLLAYERECDITDILRDSNRFIAINTSKSKSVLRDDTKITHQQLVKSLSIIDKETYEEFKVRLSNINFEDIDFSIYSISDERARLILKYLNYRKDNFYV